MLIPVRRAGAMPETLGRLVLLTIAAAVLATAAVLPVAGIFGVAARDTANTFNTLPVGQLGAAPERSVLYDAQGHVITYLYPYDVYRVPVTLSQVAPVMQHAIVAIEDSSFYSQGALDPRGTIRALLHNSGGGGLQGASTIAQQYVKNVKVLQAGNNADAVQQAIFPDLRRKIQDLRLAADVEQELTQDQLLASYLNVAYFNNNAWGIEVASEVYFKEHASQLTLPQAALLAGIVQSPTQYNPVANPAAATDRRNVVLSRMAQLNYISQSEAQAAEKTPLALHLSSAPLTTGCASPQAANAAFFCDYVQHVLQVNYPSIWKQINNTGGLDIYTSMSMQDQLAADRAVNSVEPQHSALNPGNNADAEVLIQPGSGKVRAIAENRSYGNGPGQTFLDYAVNAKYGGSADGVQTGSSSKIFTLVTALEQAYAFGHKITIKNPQEIGPFYSCKGLWVAPQKFNNAEQAFSGTETYMLGEATIESVNTYFVNLEKEVGLCNVVKTAVAMGMTRADGTALLEPDKALNLPSADGVSSFTLGSVGVSPMSMAAAYATVAAGGVYCTPEAIEHIVVRSTGKQLPVKLGGCHQAIPSGVANAANYILQRVLFSPGTAAGRAVPGHTEAAKTGTADLGFYAAFAGWTPTLAGYVSVFNPLNPTGSGRMMGAGSCYVDTSGPTCPGQMFGAMAPGATWQETFSQAALGPDLGFGAVPGAYFSEGGGFGAPTTCNQPSSGGPSPSPSPTPSPSDSCPSGHKRPPVGQPPPVPNPSP